MRPTISATAKSTKDYPRPCRGSALMGSQDMDANDNWPKAKGYAPRLAGLVGCSTGHKNASGIDTRMPGPSHVAKALGPTDATIDLDPLVAALQDIKDSISGEPEGGV